MNDMPIKYDEYEHTGVLRQVSRRAVEIELTPEQLNLIGLDKYEDVESVSIIKTKEESK